ncbi:hypothetical protein T01_11686 [Trichinella spiralis]|uniref:Uncharacterized protein n=1 Tax=Trichinella spiralis TaxID=6334 RepID=A0A0V1ARX4_TRISP|nr:hypothetical protein T01_11686 [Trichinella spiralis]
MRPPVAKKLRTTDIHEPVAHPQNVTMTSNQPTSGYGSKFRLSSSSKTRLTITYLQVSSVAYSSDLPSKPASACCVNSLRVKLYAQQHFTSCFIVYFSLTPVLVITESISASIFCSLPSSPESRIHHNFSRQISDDDA